jgi:CBS domain containing-hemolysin-like protein
VLGSTEIGKIERIFDMEIETDDFTTIAGLVINEQGKVPNVGETFTMRGLGVEVLDADERRINRLRVKAEPKVVTNETDETQKQISAGKKN